MFPQAYLKRHQITKRARVNTIANRTLISDETNGKIRDRAPADYVADPQIIPTDRRHELLIPHFISGEVLTSMESAAEGLSDEEAETLYDTFLQAREAAIIAEIRKRCGVSPVASAAEEAVGMPDEVAPDVAASEDADDEL